MNFYIMFILPFVERHVMPPHNTGRLNRRRFIAHSAKGVAGGSVLLSGCIGVESGNNNNEFTIAGALLPGPNSFDGPQPSGLFKLKERLAERTDGKIEPSVVGESQICGEGDCPSKLMQDVVQVGAASMGNSTASWAANDVWLIPYTFPSNAALAHTLVKEETWENYWVPLAEKHGVIPFYHMSPHLRNIAIGTDASSTQDTRVKTPSDIKGLSIRRTQSSIASIAIDQWGANPVNLGWGDTVQGLRSGVVDGVESWNSALVAFGMVESLGEVILNEWTIGNEVIWADVEWLQNLSAEDREIIAEETKKIHEELAQLIPEVNEKRVGAAQPPQEGSSFAENNITVTSLDDGEMNEWINAVKREENTGLYSDILESVDELGIDGEAFYEYLHDAARENSVPSSLENFQADAWWDDYIDEIEVN